jgi:hypothetical protein
VPLTYAWKVTTDREHEVRAALSLLGEVVTVDGAVVADAYAFSVKRKIPLSLGTGHSAEVLVSTTSVGWPTCTLSLDGKVVPHARKPRIPLWSWAFAVTCLLSMTTLIARHGPLEATTLAIRGGPIGIGVFLCLYTGAASEGPVLSFVLGSVCAASVWALGLALR